MRLITAKEERVVNKLVRLAGGERAFAEAVDRLRHELGESPTTRQLTLYLLQQRFKGQSSPRPPEEER